MSITSELSVPLAVSEIDFRLQSINNGGYATILAYKDARVDIKRLNSVCGVGKWQRKHEVINGNLFCSVGIWSDVVRGWSWVQDVGTESNTEKEKGQASDSFKRACFNLGIGIELYDYPLISVKLKDNEWQKMEGRQANKSTWDFKLKEWKWLIQMIDSEVLSIVAKDQSGEVRYNFKGSIKPELVSKKLMNKYFKSIEVIKSGIDRGDISAASEAWNELSQHEKSELWIGEKSGGMFSADERKMIQSSEFRQAYYGKDNE